MADFIAKLTPETATASLRAAGIGCSVEDVQVIARDERWVVPIGGDRIAWFPASELGSTRLEHFSIRLGVARVCEISFAFFFGNLFEKRGDCSPKLLNSARLHFA